jgi:hypothetical protein
MSGLIQALDDPVNYVRAPAAKVLGVMGPATWLAGRSAHRRFSTQRREWICSTQCGAAARAAILKMGGPYPQIPDEGVAVSRRG